MPGESHSDNLIIAITIAAPTTLPGDFSWRQARHKAMSQYCFDSFTQVERVSLKEGFNQWKELPIMKTSTSKQVAVVSLCS